MTILSVIRQVAPVVGLEVPSAVFSSSDREWIEMQALANEMAQRIAFDNRDWTKLKALATITGDGVATQFTLPTDYKRMLKKARLWPSSSPYAPFTHYPDSDQWLALSVQNYQSIVGAWTLIGDELLIKPVMANAATAQFYYITNKIVKDAGSVSKDEFTADTDTFRLDERVLKLGMIWQWKANKGMAYAEDMATYEDALAVEQGADKGSNILIVGGARTPVDAVFAFPGIVQP